MTPSTKPARAVRTNHSVNQKGIGLFEEQREELLLFKHALFDVSFTLTAQIFQWPRPEG